MRYLQTALIIAVGTHVSSCGPEKRDSACKCRPNEGPGYVVECPDSAPNCITHEIDFLSMLKNRERSGSSAKQLRYDQVHLSAVGDLCAPCRHWVPKDALMEDLFPLEHLSRAVKAKCLGFVLEDGTVVYGKAHPAECRK
jgi:hypothetical protein